MASLEEAVGIIGYVVLFTGFTLLCTALYFIITQKKEKASSILLTHLFIAELVYAIHEAIFFILKHCLPQSNSKLQRAHVIGSTFLAYTKCLSILWITLDRVIAVKLALKYRIFVTTHKVIAVLSVLWVISFAFSVAASFVPSNVNGNTFLIWNTCACIIIILSYVYIIVAVNIQRRNLNTTSAQSAATRLKYRIPLAISSLYILLCLLPKLVVNATKPESGAVWVYLGLFLNFNTDPFVYLFYGKQLLKGRCLCQKTSEETKSQTRELTNLSQGATE